MTEGKLNWMLWVGFAISIITCHFWEYIPQYEYNGVIRKPYYIGEALFKALVCLWIFIHYWRNLVTLFLLAITICCLLDELFFDPTKYEVNEIVVCLILGIAWFGIDSVKRYENIKN